PLLTCLNLTSAHYCRVRHSDKQTLYSGLSGVGTPIRTWRSDFGIYRQVGDLVYIDFSLPPDLDPSFPDFVTNVAQSRDGGTQLFIEEFPLGQQTCNRR
ncbi:MAG: hypothetical protein AAFY15_15950, partial [Cyanobacteria bacterium J06648_11]